MAANIATVGIARERQLVYNNVDRPVILARIGSIPANHEVNIAGVSPGRSEAGGNALTVMNLDSWIPAETMEELSKEEDVSGMRLVKLD
ncbi:MAG: hypothetical protein KAJ12_03150 [Bacteroidetes bacterium]|nr:hypothetical protein [Bacteroidota bacterium]